MDTKPHVSLFTTPAVQLQGQALPHKSALSSSSSSGSFLIRAPPTSTDDDDVSDIESTGRKIVVANSVGGSASSFSGSDSEEFASGEEFESASGEEFETASERPFVGDPDEENVKGGGFVGKYRFSRAYVADLDEEFSQNSVADDEESGIGYEYDGPVVDLAPVGNMNIKPIAQLSMDDSDILSSGGEEMGSEVEDSGFSYVAKVPSTGNLERVGSAPRIKVVEMEGGEDEPFSEPLSPVKFVDSLVSDELVGVENGVFSSSGESNLGNDSVNESMSAELVEDNGIPEALFESFTGGEEDDFKVVKNSIEQRPALEDSAQERIQSDGRDGGEIKECSAGIDSISGHAPTSVVNHVDEAAITTLGEKVEEVGVDAEGPSDCQNSSSVNVNEVVSVDLDSNTKIQIGKSEPDVMGIHMYDSLAVISVESIDGAIKGEEIQAVDSKFSEPNTTLQDGDLPATTENNRLEDAELTVSSSFKFEKPSSILDHKVEAEGEHDVERIGGRQRSLLSDEDVEELIFGSSETTKQIMNGMEERLASSSVAGAEDFQDHSQRIDGQIVMDSDEEVDKDGDGEENELFDPAALAALLKAATTAASGGGGLTINSDDGSKIFTLERPTSSGSLFPSSRPAPPPNANEDVSRDDLSEEEKNKIEKIQLLRIKFLRLVERLGHSPDDSIVAQVLYRLALAFGRYSSQAFSVESAKKIAMQREAEDKDDLDFSLNILVLGKTGVGKSATINSIFREEKATTDAFEPATTSVKVIAGRIAGTNIRILDTPGLRSPASEQNVNRRILGSIKKFMKKFPPDVVLYVDRLDTYTRDHNDLPLLRSLTTYLSSSIWQNAIVCLTHAASDPPDGLSGSPISYELFVAQQSRVIQQGISQAVGDLRLMNPSMMHPVSLIENHPSCQKDKLGESLLPNGQSWRPQLLLLCFSLTILSETNSVSKPQDPFNHKKLFGFRRSAPLSYFLSSLLQARAHPKLSADQGGDVDSDIELGDSSDSEQGEEDEYDQLPPFKPLRKSQVARLSKEQRKAYFEEYDYRVKLFQKKQWKEEVERLREVKKKGNSNDYDYKRDNEDQEDESPATVPIILPDFVLPPSFDGDNTAYRYRSLEPTSQLLVRPVLDSHGWDHDCGYDGVSIEKNLAIADQFPGAFAVQITKDKKEFNIHLDSSISTKHRENGSTMAGLDIQTVGRQLAYVLRGETKFRNFKINKTTAGLSITFLGENVATGLKIEDQIPIGKRLVLTGNAGTVRSKGDTAYGANLEVRLKDKDFPIGQDHSSLGLSLMNWRGDLSLMANLQSQFSFGRSSKMAVRIGLNNKRSGQITVKLSSSEQLQMALIGILPIATSIFRSISPGSGGKNSAY